MMASIGGHYWTLRPVVAALLRKPRPGATSHPWSLDFVDRDVGSITLTGVQTAGSNGGAALLIHGLGGSADSSYLFAIERALVGRGWTTLRVNLRGADRRGDDFQHAGFTDDLPRILSAPPLGGAERIVLVGVSLGGHLALRYAAERGLPTPNAVVSICAPLDLDRSAGAIDAPRAWLYRHYLLRAMNEIYTQVAMRRRAPTPLERVRAARRIRVWDGLVVAPRFGFTSAEDYYARASVGPLLGRIEVPTWIVAAPGDPMVPPATLRPALARISGSTEMTWAKRGGHGGFPPSLDLGTGGPPGLAGQVCGWLESRL